MLYTSFHLAVCDGVKFKDCEVIEEGFTHWEVVHEYWVSILRFFYYTPFDENIQIIAM